jgi:hypothetical protein
MAIARVTELTVGSKESFQHALQIGLARANETLRNVKSAWIQDQSVQFEGGRITEYRVHLKVTFVLDE